MPTPAVTRSNVRRLPGPGGELAVEQEQVGAGEGAREGQHPVERGNAIARRGLRRPDRPWKARKSARPRWIARASVSLRMPKPKTNGSGEAYQSWNSDQAIATAGQSGRRDARPALRPPVSASATSSSSSAVDRPACRLRASSAMAPLLVRSRRGGATRPHRNARRAPARRRPPASGAYFSQPFSL